MELQADKLLVIQALIELDDKKILQEIKAMLSEHFSKPNASAEKSKLTDIDRAKIQKSFDQYEKGAYFTHEEVQAEALKRINL